MRRVVLIGLDGAEPSLVEEGMNRGFLPALAALRERGAYVHCRSTVPPATFPAWTTCVTGLNPGKHGIFDFTELIAGRYAVRFVNATHRQAPALWTMLSAAGKRVGVLGVPATYPPEPVNGFMVSGFDTPVTTRIDRSFVFPSAMFDIARRWVFADFQESRIQPGWHHRALRKMQNAIAVKTAIALECLRREPLDFFMVVFGESDTVAHHFWLFHDPQSPRYTPDPTLRDAIRTIYRLLDEAVGRIIAAVDDPETLILVVSDHGFGGAGTGILHINSFLAEEGFLRFKKQPRANVLKWLALGAVPLRWQGRLFRLFSGAAARTESAARFGQIDWTRTLAWSEELNYFPSVRINLRGREPCGQVEPAEYDRVRNDVIAALKTWLPVRNAWRREDLYSGNQVFRAPDIVLELHTESGYSYSCLRSTPNSPCFRRISAEERFGGKERGMTGNHRPSGVLFLSEKPTRLLASLEDIAPTVLDYLRVASHPMDGTSLLGTCADLPAGPDTFAATERAYSFEQEHIIEERLRALGYWE